MVVGIYLYQRPEVPEDAVLTVYRGEHIMTVQPGDKNFPTIYLLLQAQKAVEELLKNRN